MNISLKTWKILERITEEIAEAIHEIKKMDFVNGTCLNF